MGRNIAGGLLFAAFLAGSGCATFLPEPRRESTREREDFYLVREDLRRLEGRLEGLEMETARLQAQVDDIRRRQDAAAQGHAAASREMGAEMERRIQALEAARERDRQEIVNGLSRQMAELLQQRRPAGRRTSGAETGYEHEVQPGETLSTIAAAYGVRMQIIQDVNQITDPNRLRVGQVLFIPSP